MTMQSDSGSTESGAGSWLRLMPTAGRLQRAAMSAALAVMLLSTSPLSAQDSKPGLQVNRAVVQSLRITLPTAELYFDSRGDIPDRSTTKYLPPDRATGVDLKTNIDREPRIKRVMWQVSRNPFYGPIDAPIGMVASGYTSHRGFAINLDDFYQRPALQSARARQPMGARKAIDDASAPASNGEAPRLRRLPAGALAKPQPSANPPRLDSSAARTAANVGATWKPPAPHFYVRVVPVAADSDRVIGRPSEPLELIIDEAPVPDTDMSGWEVVSTKHWDLRLVSFRFQPAVSIDRWPSGCKDIPRDEGRDAGDVIGDIPDAAVDLVNWASEAYADLKKMAISLVGTLLPFVPQSVIEIALDSALAAAGIPPSIPNFDQLMSGGADYLATQMVEQMPVPASGVLAEMAYEQAKEEMRQRTKQALLDTARELAKKKREDTKWCTHYYADPFFEVTLRNASTEPADNAALLVSNDGELLDRTYVAINHMEPGQTFTIPVAFRENKNVVVRWVSQMPDWDRRQAINDWWDSYWKTPIQFKVHATESQECLGNGTCSGSFRTLVTTPSRVWEKGPEWKTSG